MDIKVEIKEEPCFLDFDLQNDRKRFPKALIKKIKNEAVTSSSDCDADTRTEIEKVLVSNFCSQNKEEFISGDPVMESYKSNKDSESETKIEIKEEQWWLEGTSSETPYIYDKIKEGVNENFSSIESPRLFKDRDSNYKSTLSVNEDLGKDLHLNTIKYEFECEGGRKCQSQENDITDISSKAASNGLKEDGGNIDSMSSCLKQNNSFQQSDINKHINKGNHKSNVERDSLKRDSRKVHRCDICEKCFMWLSDLKRHKFIHEGIKPHKCNICDKAYKHLSHLKTHKLIHEGIKPHKCNICDKAFTQFSSLKTHKLIHEGIKPHKCHVCDKPFSRLSDLKVHTFIHEGKKPHKCNLCDKSFTQLSSLKTHTFIHEGIKPHKCNICDKAFTRLSHLKTHKLIHKSS